MTKTHHWTEADDAFIRRQFQDGVSASRIASALSVQCHEKISRCAVLGRLNRIGCDRHSAATARVRVVQGHKLRQLAEQGRMGKRSGPIWSPGAVAAIKRLWDEGLAIAEIVRRLDGRLDDGRRLTDDMITTLRRREGWRERIGAARATPRPPKPVVSGIAWGAGVPGTSIVREAVRGPEEVAADVGIDILSLNSGMCKRVLGYFGGVPRYCGGPCQPKVVKLGGYPFRSYCEPCRVDLGGVPEAAYADWMAKPLDDVQQPHRRWG